MVTDVGMTLSLKNEKIAALRVENGQNHYRTFGFLLAPVSELLLQKMDSGLTNEVIGPSDKATKINL